MPPATEELGEYLGLEEPLTGVCTARLSDDGGWTPVTVGLTDTRLVCLADEGTFVSVQFDAVSAVRGRERGGFRYGGDEHGLIVGAGAVVAAVGLLAVAAAADGLVVPGLVVAGLAALGLTERARRRTAARDRPTSETVGGETRASGGRVGDGVEVAALGRLEGRIRDRNGRVEHYVDRIDDLAVRVRAAVAVVAAWAGHRKLLLAGGGAVGCLVLAVLVVGSPLVLPGLVAVLAGAGLVDYGRRNRSPAGGPGGARDRVREVRISTDGGRDVHLRSDPADRLDRDLGRLAAASDQEHPITRSRS